jgi:hypothetical protein
VGGLHEPRSSRPACTAYQEPVSKLKGEKRKSRKKNKRSYRQYLALFTILLCGQLYLEFCQLCFYSQIYSPRTMSAMEKRMNNTPQRTEEHRLDIGVEAIYKML